MNWTTFAQGRVYRPVMRVMHRLGWCYPQSVGVEPNVAWCHWCGMRGRTVPKIQATPPSKWWAYAPGVAYECCACHDNEPKTNGPCRCRDVAGAVPIPHSERLPHRAPVYRRPA